ncbi:MAG: hypothetical protein HYR96_05005 [Deltaproteobacteria bacterium]|nr:hypothetical protein [Deltaproteobacteria bacterium]
MNWLRFLFITPFLTGCFGGPTPSPSRPIAPMQGPEQSSPTIPRPQGTDFGSGGDNELPEQTSMWFQGYGKTVHICYTVAQDFGLEPRLAESTLQTALETWRRYTLARLHLYFVEENVGPLSDSGRDLPALDFSVSAECLGHEDLHVYFGDSTPEVLRYRQQFTNPTGFAQRTHYDRAARWGRGLIWIAKHLSLGGPQERAYPDWRHAGNLSAILLHEIGHALGNDHVSGTILDANIGDRIKALPQWSSGAAQIDTDRELVFDRSQPLRYEGKLTPQSSLHGKYPRPIFPKLFGREAQGPELGLGRFHMARENVYHRFRQWLRNDTGRVFAEVTYDNRPSGFSRYSDSPVTVSLVLNGEILEIAHPVLER